METFVYNLLFRKTTHHLGELACGPQFTALGGSTDLLLTQTSECRDQAHGQKGKHGASWGTWHGVSS